MILKSNKQKIENKIKFITEQTKVKSLQNLHTYISEQCHTRCFFDATEEVSAASSCVRAGY